MSISSRLKFYLQLKIKIFFKFVNFNSNKIQFQIKHILEIFIILSIFNVNNLFQVLKLSSLIIEIFVY